MAYPLPSRVSRPWWLFLVLLILGIGGIAYVAMKPTPGVSAPVAPAKKSDRPGVIFKPDAAVPVTMAVPDYSAAVPPVIVAGHEGHGAECAACLAEKGLAACREDYAQMEFARLADGLEADEEQSRVLLESCRRFAAAVLKEWSHATSRPVLPADEVVAAQREQILAPLLTRIPRKASED